MPVTQANSPVIKCSIATDVINSTYVPGGIVDVEYMHWVSKGATVGDDLLISNGAGEVLWEDVADIVNVSKLHVLKHPVNDLTVTTMDSGTLYVIKAPSDGWPG